MSSLDSLTPSDSSEEICSSCKKHVREEAVLSAEKQLAQEKKFALLEVKHKELMRKYEALQLDHMRAEHTIDELLAERELLKKKLAAIRFQ